MAPTLSAAVSFVIVSVVMPGWIRFLKHFHLTQPIRKELPADHQAKRGTPLMAGAVLFVGVFVSLYVFRSPLMILLATTFTLFGFVGFMDDFKKAYFQDPGGISGKAKLVLQFLFTFGLLYFLLHDFTLNPNFVITRDIAIPLATGVYVVLASLFVVGSANAINFTDGLDGLLCVVAVPTYFFFFVISRHMEVRLFALVMIACLLGLLIYNAYPAKAFMGDTGSLAIGGSLSMMALIEKVELLVPLLFIIYFAEQLSVILQVFYFKRTGRRLFRMSPIHYHFCLKYGWSENTIVILFGAVSWIATLVCILYWRMFMK